MYIYAKMNSYIYIYIYLRVCNNIETLFNLKIMSE